MRTRELTTEGELRVYAERFAATLLERSKGRIQSAVSVDFLRRCRARGVFDASGDMIGGYAINETLPLRLLEFVPDGTQVRPPRGGRWEDCCEIVCMWRTRALTASRMSRIWPRVIADALATRKRFILGHNEATRLDRHYTRMGAETLYAGPSASGHPSRLLAYRRYAIVVVLAAFLVVDAPMRLVRRRSSEV
jgi:hypothetical protein